MKKNRIILSLILGIVFSSYGQTNKIENTGNVGIGTTSPLSPLQINSNSDDVLTFKTLDNNWLYTNWMDNTNKRRTWMGLGSDLSSFNITTQNGTNKILFNGGNVGIGTTNPGAKLHVNGNIRATQHVTVDKNGSYRVALNAGADGYIYGRNDAVEHKFLIHSNGSSYFNGGNVGIGTKNPSVALDVSGTSKGIKLGDTNGNLLFRNNVGGANEIRSYGLPLEIETRDTQDISFNSNNGNSKLMTIKGDGSGIGIGTTNPQEKLQIGNTYTFHDGGHKVIGFLYKPSGGVDLDPLQYSSEIRFDPVNGNFFLGTSNTVTAGPTARLSINKTGNVGIGTTNPLAKLDVRGVIKTSHSDGRYVNLFTSGDGNSYINITGGSATSRFGFQVDGSSKMSIMKNGNIGIGTADTKGFKLGVAGKIAAEEIKVALYNAWPDYVFENNYNLPTLQEVEHHIAEKGHLENIPSAAEVIENGIQLGEMNAKLLQKIEELTLYMIEQNKKTEKLIKEVEVLKQKNADLEKKIK
ncbi:hypothetical protein [uncultured Aquimarina sp.]|uniref:hypothetical protein n=1 Tax=uncultured Aquimarina sp. TaxID=575652 RepID=UPI00260CB180|nr:hypothetical protein [uncultured Aquimarina sp.]